MPSPAPEETAMPSPYLSELVLFSPGRTGTQKPSFLRKSFALTHRLGKKVGFFGTDASRTVIFGSNNSEIINTNRGGCDSS